MADSSAEDPRSTLAHVRAVFEFTVEAPFAETAPMFGAVREHEWIEEWLPHFAYPSPPKDVGGAVFTVHHGNRHSTWVTTVFDLEGGHIQYVAFVADEMVTVIDVRLRPLSEGQTHAEVCYERTALNSELNEHVRLRGEDDMKKGIEWSNALNGYFKRGRR